MLIDEIAKRAHLGSGASSPFGQGAANLGRKRGEDGFGEYGFKHQTQ